MPILKSNQINKYRKEGFTLVELIFVITISAILAGISIPSLIKLKNYQDLRTRQLAFKTTIEMLKSEAKRWGGTCILNGTDLSSFCTSTVLQKQINDTMNKQGSQSTIVTPTVGITGDENIFIATNFNKLTFSPRGFIHVKTLSQQNADAVLVMGYRSKSNPFKDDSPELCLVVQSLTGQINVRRRKMTKIQSNKPVVGVPGLTC